MNEILRKKMAIVEALDGISRECLDYWPEMCHVLMIVVASAYGESRGHLEQISNVLHEISLERLKEMLEEEAQRQAPN
jgi:hypothetical protein